MEEIMYFVTDVTEVTQNYFNNHMRRLYLNCVTSVTSVTNRGLL
jgi:hypothetical protein